MFLSDEEDEEAGLSPAELYHGRGATARYLYATNAFVVRPHLFTSNRLVKPDIRENLNQLYSPVRAIFKRTRESILLNHLRRSMRGRCGAADDTSR